MPEPGEGGGMPGGGFGGAGGFPFGGAGGMPGGGGTRSFHFQAGGPGGFRFSNAEDIFSDFFKQSGGGFDDLGGMPGGFGSSFGGSSGFGGGMPRSSRRTSSSRFDGGPRQPTPEVTVLEKPLPVSLEELYKGATKKMKIKRKKFDNNTGKQIVEDRILEVPIKPGLKAGSKIKFKDVGDQVEGGTQDLHFVVEEVSPGSPTRLQELRANTAHRKSTQYSHAMATTSAQPLTLISRKRLPAGNDMSQR